MKWTKEPPTRPGWYWWRYKVLWKDCVDVHVRVVEVYEAYGRLEASGENLDLSDLNDGEWQGPITPDE